MDLSKSYEFFYPEQCDARIHIIGCGAVGSTVAENLVRFGLKNITLYDFDTVEAHNIANQMFRGTDIGKTKVEALAGILREINPDIGDELRLEPEGYKGQRLSGYVFLCVDSIDLRREIATACKSNKFIKAMFDFRIGLTDAQHYGADWSKASMVENFLKSMDFTQAEGKEATPVSACNMELSFVPTVRAIVAYGISNFVNFIKTGVMKSIILSDTYHTCLDAF